MTESNEKTIPLPNQLDDLVPKPPPKLCQRGIDTFTMCRQADETGVSGEGVVVEGVIFATGQCVVHWLWPRPRGSVAIFDSFEDFLSVHVKSHPTNGSIITMSNGEQQVYGRVVKDNPDQTDNTL